MSGHGGEEELRQLEELRARFAAKVISDRDLLTLALLYAEPAHEEENAIQCLELVLQRDPSSALGRIWLAYMLQHYGMDAESCRRAHDLLAPLVIEGARERGAALMLSALLCRDLETATLAELVERMEGSVFVEPNWVSNRVLLADLYRRQDRHHEARDQLLGALGNVIEREKSWDVLRDNYETFITWRASFRARERIQSALEQLSKGGGQN